MASKKVVKKGTIRMHVKTGDMVVVITGKSRNHRGKIIAARPRLGKVKVEGAQIIKKHQKANPQLGVEGGIFEKENWIDASNVMLIDPESGKPTRFRYEKNDDGKKIRVAVKSGKAIPEPVRG